MIPGPAYVASVLGDGLLAAKLWWDSIVPISAGWADPLVLDLDDDGIELINIANSTAQFDLDGDSFASQVGWLDSDDGFLIRDLDSDNNVDGVGELFGNHVTPGLDVLATFDSNTDGVINSSDTNFAQLKIWRDLDQDGISDSGEVQTLSAAGIASFSLARVEDGSLVEGNIVFGRSTFTRTNSTVGETAEVYFSNDTLNTTYIGDGATSGVEVDLETLFLPLSRGYGEVAALHVAMTEDATLKTMMQDLSGTSVTEGYATMYEQVRDILFRWAGVDGVDPNGGGWGTYSNQQEQAFLEAMLGEEFDVTIQGRPNHLLQEEWMHRSFTEAFTALSTRILVQGALKGFFPDATYDMQSDELDLNAAYADVFEAMQEVAPTDTEEKQAYWHSMGAFLYVNAVELGETQAQVITDISTELGEDVLFMDRQFLFMPSSDTLAYGTLFNDYIAGDGASGNDTIFAGGGNDVVLGYAGHDVVYGGEGNDNLNGHAGNDLLDGGDGNDSLNGGDGTDTLRGGAGNDIIALNGTGGVALGGDGNDSISGNNSAMSIDGGDGNNNISAGNGNDTILAGSGNDTILAVDGNDSINAGDGANSISAGVGNDTIISGSGNDSISARGEAVSM